MIRASTGEPGTTGAATETWRRVWRGLLLRVELREAGVGGGATLRVGPDESREWLRFDCFERAPHWHLDPDGRNERHPLDERDDPVTETLERLRSGLAPLLERAGAEAAAIHDQRSATTEAADDSSTLHALECALRHRPARVSELDPMVLRRRRSEKWHTYPEDVLPVWVAEMDFPVAAPIEAEMRRFLDGSDYGYPIGLADTGLAEVFCERMQTAFGWSPDPSGVEILSEVVQGLYIALEAFSAPGEGAIVQTPIYPPFLGAVRETGRRLVEARLVPGASRLECDLDALAASIDAETRLLLFCNPHNPSGRVFDRSELTRIAEIAIANDLIVVSDEIHGDLLFDGRRHVPLSSLGPEIARRTVTLTSASKAFNIPGLRCAVAHFGDAALAERFNTVFPRHVRGGIGLHGLYASIAAWRWSQPWLDEVRSHLEANRDFAIEALGARIPEIRVHRPEATYLAWLDCSGLGLEGSPARHFLRHGRVALSDGRLFGPGWEDHARLNFATSRPILTEAIERVAKAIDR